MRPNCSICRRPDAAKINAALNYGLSFRSIRDRFGASMGTLSRHASHRQPRPDRPDLDQRVGEAREGMAADSQRR